MTYAQVQNGKVVRTGLPRTGTLSDGSIVSNYHKLDPEVLRTEGWLPLEDAPADYNPETHQVQDYFYTVHSDRVVRTPQVAPLPDPADKQAALQQQVDELEALLAQLREQLQ